MSIGSQLKNWHIAVVIVAIQMSCMIKIAFGGPSLILCWRQHVHIQLQGALNQQKTLCATQIFKVRLQ